MEIVLDDVATARELHLLFSGRLFTRFGDSDGQNVVLCGLQPLPRM